jgi:hypothetical protein
MNEHMLGEHFHSSDIVDKTAQDTDNLVLNSDPLTGQVPVLATLIQQKPAGDGTVSEFVQEAPMDQTILYKDSVGEAVLRLMFQLA